MSAIDLVQRGVRRATVAGAVLLVLGLGAAALLRPAGASAARPIALGFADPRYMSEDAGTRGYWFDLGEDSGGDWARITVGWRGIAPERPADPSDPGDPSYYFEGVDAAVRDAAKRGQPMILTLANAPDWAEGPDRPADIRPGTWKPDPAALARFAAAVAARYDGSFPDPLNPWRHLPRVSRFEIWNEPNLLNFLSPQHVGGREVAVDRYRAMLNAAYLAIHGIQPGAQVIGGSLAPIGSVPPTGSDSIGPMRFLRELLCVEGGTGEPKWPVPCGRYALMDVLGHHSINIDVPPREFLGRDDAGIAEMGDITQMLRVAEAAGTVPGGSHPVWATEFWWAPKTKLADQARYVAEGIYMLWKQRVPLAILFQIGDDAGDGYWKTGLYYPDGRPKPARTAFRFPVVGDRKSRRKVLVWGRAPAAGTVRIRVERHGRGWRTAATLDAGARDVFKTRVRLRGRGRLRATVGTERSLTWRVSRHRQGR